MKSSIKVDHVGIAVASIEDTEPVLLALGCEKQTEQLNETGEFIWASYKLGGKSGLELIQPADGTPSFLREYLDRYGSGLHHVTLEVSDLQEVMEFLREQGVPLVDHKVFETHEEVYVSPTNPTGVLFQLVEFLQPKKR